VSISTTPRRPDRPRIHAAETAVRPSAHGMGAALPTPILLAPEDDWQFFIDYRQFGRYGWFTGWREGMAGD
jgi:hypothetical protein